LIFNCNNDGRENAFYDYLFKQLLKVLLAISRKLSAVSI